MVSAKVHAHARDEATLEFLFHLSNFGGQIIRIDRLELHSLGVGTRNLQRRSDMMKMSGAVNPRSTLLMPVDIDLRGSDIRNVIQGVNKAPNVWCSPYGGVSIFADIVFATAKNEVFKKSIQASVDAVSWNISEVLAEATLKADGLSAS